MALSAQGFWRAGLCFVSAILLTATTAVAQQNGPLGGLSLPGAPGEDNKPVVASSAEASIDPATGAGYLTVRARIKSGWHIYSVTQKPGGPLKTKIKLDPKAEAELTGEPKAVTKPAVHPEPAFENLNVETHEGEAIWEVPIRLKQGVNAASAKIIGAVNAQACAESCLPPTNYPFTAKVSLAKAETGAQQSAVGDKAQPVNSTVAIPAGTEPTEFRLANLHVTLRGYIHPAVVAAGSTAKLVIEATPDKDWHVYALADKPSSRIGYRPTLIVFTNTSGLRYLKPVANVPPAEKKWEGEPERQFFHTTPVRWTAEFEIPSDAAHQNYPIEGIVGIQTCKGMLTCDLPRGIRFRGALKVGETTSDTIAPLQFSEAKYAEAERVALGGTATLPDDRPAPPAAVPATGETYKIVALNDASKNATLPIMLLFSVLGGLILNLMPCVLPVIGLKILGFAQQAGHNRRRILELNLWYTAGMILVFLALATLAAGAKLGIATQDLGWGQQFSSTAFNVVMAAIVFVMALSFLGVWEIPIPGFIGSGKAQRIATQEGASGAFAKGIFTTLLATPCSGPFLGPVFGFTLTQPPSVIYMIFFAIGLGMALPYLLIGAFPALIGWLPKPGAWMDTFKQIMGFVMLGTVAFIFSFMHKDYLVPTFVLLIALWAACWWIGRTPTYEPVGKQLAAWLQGGVVAALIGGFAFTQLVPTKPTAEDLAWQPFDRAALTRLQSEGKTVLVDFSADWCATCKWNLKFVINTRPVAEAIRENGIVPLLADWTDGSDEIKQMLASLESKSIPVLAIFPADRPGEVIVLRDTVTRSQVIEAIKLAGPSHDTTGNLARAELIGQR